MKNSGSCGVVDINVIVTLNQDGKNVVNMW